MSVARTIEMVFSADSFTAPPVAGSFFASQSGLTALAVSKVRRVVSEREAVRYRLIGLRVKLRDMPVGAALLPWPKRVKRAQSVAALVHTVPVAPRPRLTPAQEKVEARRRVVVLLRDDRDSNRVVHKVRIENKTVNVSEWKDPDDLNPNRRTARIVHGYRSRDQLDIIEQAGTLGKKQIRALRRFRRLYELGSIGLRSSKSLAEAPNGFFASGGPSEMRLVKLAEYNEMTAAIGPSLTRIILDIIINDETVLAYSERKGLNRMSVSGYLLAAADATADWFEKLEERAKRENEQNMATVAS